MIQKNRVYVIQLWCFLILMVGACTIEDSDDNKLVTSKDDRIVLIGNNLCSRMQNFGYFETAMHLRYPDQNLFIRNMCDGANTPGFRPHSGRYSPWAFPGAEEFQDELGNFSNSKGHFETPDQWLSRLKADIIIAFFGYSESFAGEAGLANFKNELDAFVQHSLSQQYNAKAVPKLVLVSPLAFENLSDKFDLPNGQQENKHLAMYSEAMEEISNKHQLLFVNIFEPSKQWYKEKGPLTIDGFQLNEHGYQKLAKYLADHIFKGGVNDEKNKRLVLEAVKEKNWYWHDDFKSPNGVHVFGRRYEPFGPDNYPDEIKKKREMTAIRDQAIWEAAKGRQLDLSTADNATHSLPSVPTNYKLGDYGRGEDKYLYGDDALSTLKTPEGYKVELFASEKEFPDLANPVQISFDNKGRLWVAVMPTYPHYRAGDPKPNDKLIILEDTDGDNKADKQTIFADGLHIPVGFELASEGVYISQGTNLKLYTDTNGDDIADQEEIILSGFDDHDTHHAISAFSADPSGAIYMGEGVFLHSNIETPYGPIRATNGGFFRYNPTRKHLQRVSQVPIPNPWGIAFDEWGQCIFLETSGAEVRWMLPGSIKPRYGQSTSQAKSLVQDKHKVRPTSGIEFIYSRHFPDEVQGDILLNNCIGFLGMREHKISDDGTGFEMEMRQDLVVGSDQNFRPVDLEFAPDGSLYFVDWHNVLIGHMQHNARDPLRDHVHGRIYRITYPSRPLVSPAQIDDASIETLLNNLKLPEYRSRYRSRRALRDKKPNDVMEAIRIWTRNLDKNDSRYEHHLLEALWVSWGINNIDKDLLAILLKAKNYRARAAAVHAVRYNGHQLDNQEALLMNAAKDTNSRVRLEAIVAASWLAKDKGLRILNAIDKQVKAENLIMDKWTINAFQTAKAHLNGENYIKEKQEIRTHLEGADKKQFIRGKELYEREAYCGTCHQKQGQGLSAAGYPPLRQSKWVTEDEDRLIKLTLKGIYGPMVVLNSSYNGTVPMTAFEGLMTDEEIAAVLTYVRNSFGNRASIVSEDKVKEVRASISNKEGFYLANELLNAHPFKDKEENMLNNLIPELN